MLSSKSHATLNKFKIDEATVCLSVCVSLANDSSETINVIIIKFGTVTASDMQMHHVLIVLSFTFIQGHTELNHENTKSWIISETVQAMPKFAVKTVRLNVCLAIASPMTSTFIQGDKCVSLTTF